MINQEIADIFSKMSSYVELLDPKNGFFRARAYRRASDIIASLSIDLNDDKFIKSPQLLVAMEGIGVAIANHIVEYLTTGKISEYEEMKAKSPVKLEELLKVQGLGPKKILKLYKELKITDIQNLKDAAESHKISTLEGFGDKSEQNIIESIGFAITNKDKKPYYLVEPIVNEILEYMRKDSNIIKIGAFGSFRRKKEMIGDIDLLASSSNPENTMNHFVNIPSIEKVLGSGDTKSSIWLKHKIQADLRIIPEKSWGAASQYFTGNKEHNVKLRNIAISKGYKLSEYSLSDRKTEKVIESESEVDIYKKLGLDFIIPELRENNGEIESAAKHELPDVISSEDISGDLHMHTVFSDGVNSIDEMLTKAKKLGYSYIGISDHVGLAIANGIPEESFQKYIHAIHDSGAKIDGIKVYAGVEAEVDKDGNYSFPEELLSELDYVIAGVHLSTKMDFDKMTKRLEKVIKNPLTKILAHPTGRILGQRPGYEFDFEYIFNLCCKYGVAVEINADPNRLDLTDSLVRLAVNSNCKIEIGSDAHSANSLENIQYGVNIARRGWVTKADLFVPSF